MRAFIVDFNEWVKQSLGDPAFSKRVTSDRILRELEVKHLEVYENILRISSGVGYTETEIIIQNGKEFYPLPGNFRRFRGLEKRIIRSESNSVTGVYSTLHPWEPGPGIEILSGQNGFKIRPVPILTSDETWTLKYQAGTVILHYGTAREVGNGYIDFQSDLPSAQGEIVSRDDYYKGSLIGIVSADSGVGQVMECSGYLGADNRALLRHDFSSTPTGAVVYEIRPILPRPYHKLIALGAAITFAAERRDFQGRATLIHEWRELWRATKNYFGDVTTDSAPRYQDIESSGYDPYELSHI